MQYFLQVVTYIMFMYTKPPQPQMLKATGQIIIYMNVHLRVFSNTSINSYLGMYIQFSHDASMVKDNRTAQLSIIQTYINVRTETP